MLSPGCVILCRIELLKYGASLYGWTDTVGFGGGAIFAAVEGSRAGGAVQSVRIYLSLSSRCYKPTQRSDDGMYHGSSSDGCHT